MCAAIPAMTACKRRSSPTNCPVVLLELAPGATTQQVRFAALANLPDIKVMAGELMLTAIRQGLAALLNGVLGLMVIMFVSTALMVSVLFSAIITELRACHRDAICRKSYVV